jgi:hypothetical protein
MQPSPLTVQADPPQPQPEHDPPHPQEEVATLTSSVIAFLQRNQSM